MNMTGVREGVQDGEAKGTFKGITQEKLPGTNKRRFILH